MKVFLGIALCVQLAFASAVVVTTQAQTQQIAQWTDVARTLSQENSSLSTRTYDLLLLTTPTSPSDAATAFAVALCSQDGAAAYAALSPSLKANIDAGAQAHSLTPDAYSQALVTLPEGTVCTNVVYRGSYIGRDGDAVIIYVFIYTDQTTTWGETYLISVASDGSGVSGVQ